MQLLHIAFNMFALYLFGPQLELFFGRVRYLALYFISALTGSAARLLGRPASSPRPSVPRARSSGCSARCSSSRSRCKVNVQGIVVLLAINFLMTFSISNISWQGHVGGFVGGVLVAGILVYAPAPAPHGVPERRPGRPHRGDRCVAIVARTAALA